MIKLVGPNNPYQDGAQGVVQEGAYADLLLVEGNPLEDILVMTKPDENFKVIMKDGVIYKNTLLLDTIDSKTRREIKKIMRFMPGQYN